MSPRERLAACARLTARVLTGTTYVRLGLDAAQAPGVRTQQAAGLLARLRKLVPLPATDELLVRVNGTVQALAGAVLISGRAQRFAALTLVGSLIPTTAAGHAFWTLDDPVAHKAQRVQFQKNMAMIGGLLFAVLADQARGERDAASADPA